MLFKYLNIPRELKKCELAELPLAYKNQQYYFASTKLQKKGGCHYEKSIKPTYHCNYRHPDFQSWTDIKQYFTYTADF